MSLCLVTGGAGFIGSSLARALIARGDRVRVIDNFSSGKRENLADIAAEVELIEGDILDDRALARAIEGVELVFHEAAIPSVPKSMAEPIENHAANATGTLRVLERARQAGIRRLVYAASSAAYGDDPQLPKIETMPPAPISPYGGSKLAGEQYAQIYARAYGVETVCLRYFNVFGPRQDPASEYAAVIPKFITAALAGQAAAHFGDGSQSRDFCTSTTSSRRTSRRPAADAGRSRAASSTSPAARPPTSTGWWRSSATSGAKGRRCYERAAPGTSSTPGPTSGRPAARLGYTAGVSFAEGLGRTIDWYKSRG